MTQSHDHDPSMGETFKGVLLVCLGTLALMSMDFFAKALREHYGTFEIVFYRALIGLFLLFLIAALSGQLRKAMTFKSPHIHLGRSICMGLGLCAFIYALDEAHVATLTAVAFAMPLVATLMAVLFLGEKIHLHRWTAIIVGFGGVMIIVQPHQGEVSIPVLLVLGSTVLWSLAIVLTKRAPKDLHSLSIAFYFMVFLLIGTAVPTAMAWTMPPSNHWPLILGLGACGAMGQIFLVYGYRLAPVSVASPFEYTAIIWAVAGDVLLFSAFPELHVWIGTVIIIGSGLYIAYRERVRHSTVHATRRRRA